MCKLPGSFFHAFGRAGAGFSGAAEDRIVAALFAHMTNFVFGTFATADGLDVGVATWTEVFLTDGHDFGGTLASFLDDVVHHDRFAFRARHRDRVAWFQGLGFSARGDRFEDHEIASTAARRFSFGGEGVASDSRS